MKNKLVYTIDDRGQLSGDRNIGKQFIERYLLLQGRDPLAASEWTRKDAGEASRHISGLQAFDRRRLAQEPHAWGEVESTDAADRR